MLVLQVAATVVSMIPHFCLDVKMVGVNLPSRQEA